MSERILVAFATKHGSTREVADAIAATLRRRGHEVDVQPAAKVKVLGDYGLVVLGAPLYTGKWHKDAHRFLKRHQSILEGRPVAIFALGPRKPPSEGTWPRSWEQLDGALAKHPWLAPAATVLFGGADPPKKGREPRDQRDWQAINRWASEIFPSEPAVPPLTPVTNKTLFDGWPERYEAWFATPVGRLVKDTECRLILEMLSPLKGEKILDAGCGTGVFTLDYLDAGAEVVGLDISGPMLAVAEEKAADYPFVAVQGDMLALPFPDDSFDKAVSVTALEFVEDGRGAIDELFRVTRPGGVVVVGTLNSLSPWAARRRAKTERGERHVLEDAFFRTPDELLALGEDYGWQQTRQS